jgi:hypothetical protein
MRNERGNTEAEARWKTFWEQHKDFDSSWARNVLHNLSEFLSFVFKFEAVSVGLKELYAKSDVKFPSDFDWKQEWTDASWNLPATILRELPIFKLALALRAYAHYGILVEDEDIGDAFDAFLIKSNFFPREWGWDKEMDETISAAVARHKLDETHESLTPDELAALARVSRKSVMNLVAPGKNGVLQKDLNDRIIVESARRWLLARQDFYPTILQRASPPPNSEMPPIIEPLFVPVAADGTWFSPGVRHPSDNSYCVADGNDERKFDEYWIALDFLARAASPRWRYADTAGRWRVKTAIAWERKARQEAEALLSRIA